MDAWIAQVTEALGITAMVDVDAVLDVARDAAHQVMRPAAPVTTYLLGIAVAGGADVHAAAETIRALAVDWTPSE